MKLLRIACFVVTTIAIPHFTRPTLAASSARMLVSATVRPWTSLNAIQHSPNYRVRYEDIERGYIDLPDSLTVNLKTNLNKEIAVIISQNGGTNRILIRESGSGNYSENFFAINPVHYRPGELISKKLDSRIILPKDATEGLYRLEITVTQAM